MSAAHHSNTPSLRSLSELSSLCQKRSNNTCPMKKTNALFICVGNSCRSQMAEGYARAWGKTVMNARSAGTFAIDFISPPVIEVMREEGIDISHQQPEQLSREMVEWADLVIVLGGTPESIFPDLLHEQLIHWPTPDPFGQSIERVREVRDMIKTQVTDLIIDLSKETKE